jgi:hypothetical protein
MAKKPPIVARPPRPSVLDFRAAIAQAETDGLAKDALVLRLTHRDENELKRDRSVAIEEISFLGGKMTFLGVTVVTGGVVESVLDRGGA